MPPVETTRAAICDKDSQYHLAHASTHRNTLERGHEPAAQTSPLVCTCDLDLVTVSENTHQYATGTKPFSSP